MPYMECPECNEEVYYDKHDVKVDTHPDEYYKIIRKAQDRIMKLYNQLIIEYERAPSQKDENQINLLQGQINILKYIIDEKDQ